MAYIDGAGSGTMVPMTAVAHGSKFTPSVYAATAISPEYGVTVATLTPTFRSLTTGDPSPYSVQYDVATDSGFTNIVWTSTLTNQIDGFHNATAPGSTLADLTQYYWRVRAGTGAWSATQVLYINQFSGVTINEVYSNVGVTWPADYDILGVEQMYLNLGVYWPEYDILGIEQMYLNMGAALASPGNEAEQMYLNVDESTPTPFIWILVPDSARPGDGVKVYGHGFGQTQLMWTGVVEAYLPDQDDWVPVQVVTWQTFPPTADAYTVNRLIDPIAGHVDWQHEEIEILVEEWMEPLGYLLRVRTDGP